MLKVGDRDDAWPGWVWCTNVSGKGGWVPDRYLHVDGETATVIRDYSAKELSVSAGEKVIVVDTESAWSWVTNTAGQSGWVPESCIENS